MSISSESSASRAAKMTEEPAPVKGPPRNVVTGLIKARQPAAVGEEPARAHRSGRRPWQRRALRLARRCDQGLHRVRGVLPGRVVHLPDQRRPRRRGRPRAPDQTVPARSPPASCRPGWRTALPSCSAAAVAGGLLPCDAEPGRSSSASTSRCSWPTASASNTKRCSTSASSRRRI